jgi:hypothetical protein
MEIKVPTGDAFDKLSILEIKLEHVKDKSAKNNIENELKYLKEKLQSYWTPEIKELYQKLKSTNQEIWDIEDAIRIKEKNKEFDQEFVEIARSVYITNDRRCKEKNMINSISKSDFFEEKIYDAY